MPYIFFVAANFVLVLALPAKLAVIVPALKLPLLSLLTIVLERLLEVILVAIFEIVEELIPPTVFTIGAAAVPPKSPANCTIP